MFLAGTCKEANSQPTKSSNELRRVSELISEKSTWENFDWKKPETSMLLNSKGWDEGELEKSPSTPQSNLKLLKRAYIQIGNIQSEIEYQEAKDSQYRSYPLFLLYNSGFCNQLETWGQKTFGTPSAKIDTSYNLLDGLRAVNRDYQWNIGNKTIATLNCVGFVDADSVKDGKSALVSLLKITAYQNQKLLKPLIYLDCKIRQKESQQASKRGEEIQLELIINENHNRVLNREFMPIAGEVELSPSSIKFNFWGSKNRKIKTEINRLDGSYRGTLQVSDANQQNLQDINLVGRCEAIKSQKAIF